MAFRSRRENRISWSIMPFGLLSEPWWPASRWNYLISSRPHSVKHERNRCTFGLTCLAVSGSFLRAGHFTGTLLPSHLHISRRRLCESNKYFVQKVCRFWISWTRLDDELISCKKFIRVQDGMQFIGHRLIWRLITLKATRMWCYNHRLSNTTVMWYFQNGDWWASKQALLSCLTYIAFDLHHFVYRLQT